MFYIDLLRLCNKEELLLIKDFVYTCLLFKINYKNPHLTIELKEKLNLVKSIKITLINGFINFVMNNNVTIIINILKDIQNILID